MADRYWVGGTGTWDGTSTSKWSTTSGGASGASAPTSADNVIVDTNSGNGNITIAATAACNDCTINWTAVKTNQLILSGNFSPAGNLTINGNSVTNRIFIYSSVVGTQRTITCNGTLSCSNVDLMDIAGAGSASWDLSAISGGSGDCGGNSGITFTTGATQTATGTSSFTWSTHGWTSRVPLPQDDVVINNAFSASQTITVDMPRLGKSVTCTCTGNPLFSAGGTIYGSFVLASGMTCNNSSGFTFSARLGTHTITTNGVNLGSSSTVTINAPGATYSLGSNLTFNGSITLSAGNFNAETYNLSINSFVSNVTTTRVLTMGTGTWTLSNSPTVWTVNFTNLTVSADNATIEFTSTNANAITFAGGGNTYGVLKRTAAGASRGTFTITGSNTFGVLNVSNSSAATTLYFTAGTTTTISSASGWQVNGTSGKNVTVTSATAATHTISCASGVISSDYLTLSYSTATGGAGFFAGANSTNSGNNSGWNFAAPAILTSSSNPTGGTITTSGPYRIHTFTSGENFVTNGTGQVDVLVVGGGGGGAAGGGGAGGYKYETLFTVANQTYAVTVGDGGTAGGGWNQTTAPTNGQDSVFSTITATGGGKGGRNYTDTLTEPGAGGSGGGGTYSGVTNQAGGTGTAGQGSDGGATGSIVSPYPGGGGGGAGGVGSDGASSTGGAGGSGTANSISGSSVTYAGGGGGGVYGAGTGGTASGGGGAGGANAANGTNGTANTGGGGGGAGGSGVTTGGTGGSGIVIIRYVLTLSGGTVTGGSLRDMERQFYSQLVSSGYGTIEDLKAKYFISQVGGANPHDAERKFLQSKGATGNSLSEMWNSYLDSRGIAGKLSDKLKKFYMGYTFS